MKDLNKIKSRLCNEYFALDNIKAKMFEEVTKFAKQAAIRAGKRSERHIRNIQLLTRIIEDHSIETEIAEMTR